VSIRQSKIREKNFRKKQKGDRGIHKGPIDNAGLKNTSSIRWEKDAQKLKRKSVKKKERGRGEKTLDES